MRTGPGGRAGRGRPGWTRLQPLPRAMACRRGVGAANKELRLAAMGRGPAPVEGRGGAGAGRRRVPVGSGRAGGEGGDRHEPADRAHPGSFLPSGRASGTSGGSRGRCPGVPAELLGDGLPGLGVAAARSRWPLSQASCCQAKLSGPAPGGTTSANPSICALGVSPREVPVDRGPADPRVMAMAPTVYWQELYISRATWSLWPVSTDGRPPWRLRARAAASPAALRSRMRSRSNSARAATRSVAVRTRGVAPGLGGLPRSPRR